MKVPVGQHIEECIRDDVHDLVVKTGRVPKLAYLANMGDATNLLRRLRPDITDAEFHARDFELRIEGGLVRVVGDRYAPRGAVHRMVVCACGAFSLYTPGVDQCLNCLTLKPRPYAPGEKMTDRHPDSVIAQVVEDTIEKRAQHLQKRAGYRPLAPQPEPVIRMVAKDGALYVDTPAGPIKVTADPTVPPGEVAFAQPGAGEADYRMPPAGGWSLEPPRAPAGYRPARIDWAKLQKAPAQPGRKWVEPVEYTAPARPDGFDQHQVDAAKAALLAPVPPRYPRTR